MAAPQQIERVYSVTNIKQNILIILDADDHNYDAWRELLLTHCQSFDVAGHLDRTTLPTNDDDMVWKKQDGIVKLWLYGTVTKDFFRSIFKTGGSSREVWLRIENFFRNNKEARAIQLDHDLRNRTIGDQTIQAYCQDLKLISDLLTNVDAPVTERTLVTYLLNGLNAKYDNIINVIIHRQPFPTFEEARSMLLLEEDRLNKGKKNFTNKASSSDDKVLAVTDATNDKRPAQTTPQQYHNKGRGSKKSQNRGGGRGYYNKQCP